MNSFTKKYIGDRTFYSIVLSVAVPIMIQNGITNFVNLLDNIMVGRVGTEQMSGVAIANQILFVYNLILFGGLSGAGIFTAQFFGSGDSEGIRNTVKYKLILGTTVTAVFGIIVLMHGTGLIGLYLSGEAGNGNPDAVLYHGIKYTKIMLWGIPLFMVAQVYSATLRECGETLVPMYAGIVAVFLNLFLNWILIYGNLGFKARGTDGAAIATVISRYAEASVIICYILIKKNSHSYLLGLFKPFKIPRKLAGKIFVKGSPLMLNEMLWSSAMAFLAQIYSTRGLSVVASYNIASTLNDFFKVIFIAFGNSVAIMVGQLLGAGKMDEARDTDRKIIFFSFILSAVMGVVMCGFSKTFPMLYNTREDVRTLASMYIVVFGSVLPMGAVKNAVYFTLRSGGNTWITLFYDGVLTWILNVTLAFALCRLTNMSPVLICLMVQLSDIIKALFGLSMVRKGIWINKIVR